MYLPKDFEEHDPERLRSFIQRYPLGSLVTATRVGWMRTTFPSLCRHRGCRWNASRPHRSCESVVAGCTPNAHALVIFQGPDSFISPSWYPSKRENARVVPTWNYAVVHVHGVLRFIDDSAWVRSHVEALTHEHEGKRDPPWAVTDAPAEFVEKMVAAVVGIEISITRCRASGR